MGKLSIVSAAAILVSAAALPSMAQAQCAAQDEKMAAMGMPREGLHPILEIIRKSRDLCIAGMQQTTE